MPTKTLPIIGTTADQIPEKLLVMGDPGRVLQAAERLDDVVELSHHREYRFVRGSYQGQVLGLVSHGVGSAGAGACFEELCRSGAKHIIRVGTAGGMQNEVVSGDLVIATGAVREDGLSPKLVPLGYPALVSADVQMKMRQAAADRGHQCHEGLLLTHDLFYPQDVLGTNLKLWQQAGVKAVEMEAATLLVIAGLHGVAAGAIVAIDGNPLSQDDGSMETYNPNTKLVGEAVSNCLDIALDTLCAC